MLHDQESVAHSIGLPAQALRSENVEYQRIAEGEKPQAITLERRPQQVLTALLQMAEAMVHVSHETQSFDLVPRRLSASEMTHRLADLTRSVLDCRRVAILAVDPDTEILYPVAIVGLLPEMESQWWQERLGQRSGLRDSANAGFLARLRSNEVFILDMTQPPYNTRPNPYAIYTLLMAPMLVGDQLVGLLTLDYGSASHHYTDEEKNLAKAIAKLAALAIERDRLLYERAEAHASELTLRESNRLMEEFMGMASHELRNPLTAVQTNIQLANRQLVKSLQTQNGDKPDVDELINRINAAHGLLQRAELQSRVLNRLIGDLVDVSRIQTNKLELQLRLERCDLTAMLQEAVQNQRQAHPGRALRLAMSPGDPVFIMADAGRIGQVINNYLTNACKYSLADAPVDICLQVKGQGQVACVEVRDRGRGLSFQEQQHVWERFYQAQDAETEGSSGSGLGLGLYISRAIIESHHGQVGVASPGLGSGSTFWFTLPLTA